MKLPTAVGIACALASPATAEILPEVSVHLRAARYLPADEAQRWQGWIGAGAGLLRVHDTTAYFTADVETIIGHELRGFDANQASWHLEAGLRRRAGPGEATVFFNHVSRHYVDRPKTQAVDWNELGARYSWPVRAGARPVRATVSLGHTTLASLVGYRWIASAHVDAEPARAGNAAVFVRARVRGVTIARDADPGIDRGSFLDASAEIGPRWSRDGRALDLFAAAERRNDVRLEVPDRRDRVLIGFRISYLR